MNLTSESIRYQVKIKGALSEAWAGQFGGMRLTSIDGCTILEGAIDQAALFGVLSRIRDLGMPLLLVEQIEINCEEEKL